MPPIPAFCRSCGRAFASGIFAENVRGLTLSGNTSQCPYCGGIGDIPDGVFDVFDDVIRVVSSPSWTVDRLNRLAGKLSKAREQKASPEAVAEIVDKEDPQLASVFRRLLVPADAGQFYGLLAVIVTILLYLASQGNQASPEDVERITNQAVERCVESPQTTAPAPSVRPAPASSQAEPKRRKRPPKNHGKTKRRKRR
jgi:hypothetical protein